ncbi:MAG: hypothetical protein ACYDBJ_14800 [Aggregatilineales bacterium]
MADNKKNNTHQQVAGSLESQRQPEPVADSVRLAQEKGSTHQFTLPEIHDVDVPHLAPQPTNQPLEARSPNKDTKARVNSGRKHTASAKSAKKGQRERK